jgi:hypothetical protein
VVEGFATVLGVQLIPRTLDDDERRHALARACMRGEKPWAAPPTIDPLPSRLPHARR